MSLINKILQTTLCLSLAILVFCLTFVGVFKSNQQLTQVLDKADFYTAASKLMADQINTQLVGEDQELGLAKQSIEQGITSSLARSTLQPIQIALIAWLTSDQPSLKLDLDLQAVKTKVTNSVESAELKFSLTKLIPDNLELTDTDNIKSGDLILLNRARSLYKLADDSIPILGVIVCVLAGLLFIINIHKGSRKLTSILFATAGASIVGLLAVGLSYLVDRVSDISSNASQQELGINLSIRVLAAVVQQTLWYYIIIGIISVSGIIIAKVIFKKRDKKLKDKKK